MPMSDKSPAGGRSRRVVTILPSHRSEFALARLAAFQRGFEPEPGGVQAPLYRDVNASIYGRESVRFVINLKIAKELDVEIAPALLARADGLME